MSFSDDELRAAWMAADSIADALRSLGLVPAGGNYESIKHRAKNLGLDTNHMLGRKKAAHLGLGGVKQKPLSEVLVNGRRTNSSTLRKRLIAEGVFERRCYGCNRFDWDSSLYEERTLIPLELDHIDGDRYNNTLSNLRLLCPNCHALTETYRGRNKNKGSVKGTGIPHLLKIGGRAEVPNVGSMPTTPTPENQCVDCFCWISIKSSRCKPCASRMKNQDVINWPTEAEAYDMYEMCKGNISEMSRRLGVSDNAIRKRYVV